MKLTDTQQAILELIAERIEAEGVPPSQTEIARAFGFSSVRAAQYHLEALEAAGAIERVPGRARGIRVLAPVAAAQQALDLPVANDDALHLPVLGQLNYSVGKASEALPVLDVWPWRYATVFEYQPSAQCPQPLSIRDPQFYACYRALGDFPEVNVGGKWLLVRMLTAFGAGLVPIL